MSKMNATQGFVFQLLRPLILACDSSESCYELLRIVQLLSNGTSSATPDDDLVPSLNNLRAIVNSSVDIIESLSDDATFRAILPEIQKIIAELSSLTDGRVTVSISLKSLIEYLLADWVLRTQPNILRTLNLFGLARRNWYSSEGMATFPPPAKFESVEINASDLGYIVWRFDFSGISALFKDPEHVLPNYYFSTNSWRTLQLEILPTIAEILQGWGLPAAARVGGTTPGEFGAVWAFLPGRLLSPETDDDFDRYLESMGHQNNAASSDFSLDTGFGIVASFSSAGDPQFLIKSYAVPKLQINLDAGWTLVLECGGHGATQLNMDGFAVVPDQTGASLSICANFHHPEPDHESPLNSGQAASTGFSLGDITVVASLNVLADSIAHEDADSIDYMLCVNTEKTKLSIAPDDGDSFLKFLLPANGLSIDLEAGMSWSRKVGLSFSGGCGLSLVVPLNKDLGIVSLHTLAIEVKLLPDIGALRATVGLTCSVVLGPVTVTIEDIGLELDLGFPPDGGNLGPVDLDFGFLPPTGLGLVINAPGLTGGGFIHFEPDEGRYWGALELNFAELAQISAFVLIETKIPGIDFSFLAMLFADDLNIPLGMGFVLQGVGGMFAMNRGVDQKALEDIFWAGRANKLLFPGPEGVENAASLFTDLRAIFPARDGQFVFGPAVKIDWGSPTVVSLSLGIFVELPDPVSVTLVGTLSAGFPILEAPLIQINVDLLGRFDPEGEFFYLYGHLRDSNILGIDLTGDMALVINWGPHPYFAFSVGGFHPSYSAPADFPKLKRITASVHEGPFNLEQQTYLALTSNSLQFGQSVEASFEVAGFGLKGGYSYDCLFQWDPLYLEANFAAHLDILAGGETIFSCRISANLSGPSPWRLWGEAYIDLWLFEVSLPFDVKFGGQRERTKLDAPILKDIFTTELSDLTHWQGSLRGQRSPVRTQLHGQKGLVDPLCTLSFSQDKMPLGEVLEQYGSRPLPTPVTMAITGVSYNETSLAPLTPVMGPFARGQFKKLTNAQRLSLPDFESFEAGKAVDAQALMASGNGLDYNLTFETHVVKDQNTTGIKLDPKSVNVKLLRRQRALSSAHRAQFPHTRGRKTPDLSDCLEGIFSR